VRICPGRYTSPSGGNIANISKNLTLVAAGVGANGATLDAKGAANAGSAVNIFGSPASNILVAIRDMIITGGNSPGGGGASLSEMPP
jgi:hypothetical protein